MSLLDTYRRNVARKREDIAKLQKSKAKELAKIANITKKLNSHRSHALRGNVAPDALRHELDAERGND